MRYPFGQHKPASSPRILRVGILMPDSHEARPLLSIVIPIYQSESTIGELVREISALKVDGGLEIILVNDGSPDASGSVCRDLMKIISVPITLIEHARNFGEHNAVMTGYRYARGSYVVTMDDDLQNPPAAAVGLYDYARNGGWDVVYARYKTKQHERWRNAGSYFANAVADSLLPKPKGMYLASFRCISSFVVAEIIKYNGPFPYIDGMISQTTNNISTFEVEHLPRHNGTSGYTLPRLIDLLLNMATGFSLAPLRISVFSGVALIIFGIISVISILAFGIIRSPDQIAIVGLLGVIFIGSGAQMVFLGVVGEYVGRTLLQSAGKPQAVVRSVEVSNFGPEG
jgi:undecaprenyl-phosphate 4-deoxy-4-formamido-L-arabinose transferase